MPNVSYDGHAFDWATDSTARGARCRVAVRFGDAELFTVTALMRERDALGGPEGKTAEQWARDHALERARLRLASGAFELGAHYRYRLR